MPSRTASRAAAVRDETPISDRTEETWWCTVRSEMNSRLEISPVGQALRQHREDLLGTSDLQSLADLTNSLNVVTKMRLVPATYRLALILAAAALVPMLPLLLLQYPIAELAGKLFKLVLSF